MAGQKPTNQKRTSPQQCKVPTRLADVIYSTATRNVMWCEDDYIILYNSRMNHTICSIQNCRIVLCVDEVSDWGTTDMNRGVVLFLVSLEGLSIFLSVMRGVVIVLAIRDDVFQTAKTCYINPDRQTKTNNKTKKTDTCSTVKILQQIKCDLARCFLVCLFWSNVTAVILL